MLCVDECHEKAIDDEDKITEIRKYNSKDMLESLEFGEKDNN